MTDPLYCLGVAGQSKDMHDVWGCSNCNPIRHLDKLDKETMTARSDLLKTLYWGCPSDAEANERIDNFAHELAEKIRNHPDRDHWNADGAADLIDPEMT